LMAPSALVVRVPSFLGSVEELRVNMKAPGETTKRQQRHLKKGNYVS
jgi:hypothetical protein